MEVQQRLNVEKSKTGPSGRYKYRSKEDILEAAKPLCHERDMTLECTDRVECEPNGWVYVATTAQVRDVETGESIAAVGLAREPESSKFMSASQITGSAASYAGKRALGNLFAIDDTEDADAGAPEPRPVPAGPFDASCRSCGTVYRFADKAQYDAWVARANCCPSPDWHVR